MAKKKRPDRTGDTGGVLPPTSPPATEVGAIVHDLRNVFSAIRGYATVVREELRPGDPAADDLDQILKAVDRGVTVSQRLSAVRVRLGGPSTGERAAPEAVDADQSEPWRRHRPRRAASILVVEDDELLREMMARVLRRNGYTILEAGSGTEAEARALAHGLPVDMLLVDVGLPVLSGPEVVERLKQRWPGVKVLFMSGFSRGVLADRGLQPGLHLLEKPFSPAALIERIEILLAPGSS